MEETQQIENSTPFIIPQNKISHKKILVILVGLFIFLLASYGVFYGIVIVSKRNIEESIARHRNAYYAGILQNNPAALQNSFVDDIKNGLNDKYTKSDAYFVTHRFFDNGGNIYEIYDYVNSHPELAFLKEAEAIYPSIFKQIHEKVVPAVPCDRAMYAYLAYVEVLRNHGYTDIAAIGTMANQYAKLSYFLTVIAKDMPVKEGVKRSKNVKHDTKKALEFIKFAKSDVVNILNNKLTSDDVTPRDILVGLNQYAAALRYLEALSALQSATSTLISKSELADFNKQSKEIFMFTMDYSHRNVPELRHFTSILNASTLVILDSSTPEEVRVALYPVLDLDLKKTKLIDNSIIHKVLDSRFEKKAKNLDETEMDLYSKRNILMLAKKVPEFKVWLISNGWTEADFK